MSFHGKRGTNRKRSIKVLPKTRRNAPRMAATTDTRLVDLPKNKTGVFAGNTLQEVKPGRNQLTTVPASFRNNASANLLLASSDQTQHRLQQSRLPKTETDQYHPTDGITNDPYSAKDRLRNGFRPSTLRRQKLRLATGTTPRDNNSHDSRDFSSRQSCNQSPASARLKSEIDHINSRLKIYRDLGKNSRLQHNQDIIATPQSALSHSTSCRLSSASTNQTVGRTHPHFSSAKTNPTVNALASISTLTDTSNKYIRASSGLAAPSPPINEEDDNRQGTNSRSSHAYQIPQQSNIGSESIFVSNFPSEPLIKSRSVKNNHHRNGNKSVSCPFYVMYFTNLAIQQRHNNEIDPTPLSVSARATAHKVPITSRINTSYSRHQSTRKRINSPISMNTYSTIDDDNSISQSTSYYTNKRFSAKIAAFENENSHLLKDILRTTSWNHVQV